MATLVSEQAQDAELVERAKQGSTDALGALFHRYAPGVHRMAYALLRSAPEADDVVQDVFLGLPRALRGYAGRGPLEAWIRRVAARTALMRMRAHRRRREDPLELHAAPRAVRDAPVDRVALERAIGALPEPLRVVFVLKVVEGYPHEEIARLAGITPETSKVRLFRARKALQSLLS
ncbi:MAG: RNA polymerase sigma factor [Longimicrobiaceae bacterium]